MPSPTLSRIVVCCASGLVVGLLGCSTMKGPATPQFADRTPSGPDQRSVMVPGGDMGDEEREPKHPERVHVAYGRWQEQQKQLPQARESYQKALDLDPRSIDALLGLSRLEQLAGRSVDAEKNLQKAQKLRPKDPLVHAAWGEYYASQKQWAPAVKKYRDAIELAPDEPLYKHQLAVILSKSGDWEGAFSAFSTIVSTGEAHYNVGYLQHQQGLLVEAERHLRLAVEAKPDLALAAALLAKVQRERNGQSAIAQQASPTVELTESGIQPAAAWQTSEPSPVARSRAEVGSAKNLTPQQLEQWSNQQSSAAGR